MNETEKEFRFETKEDAGDRKVHYWITGTAGVGKTVFA